MKKAFAFIGSNQGKISCTAQFAHKIFEKASELSDVPFEYEILTSNNIKLDYCQGCCLCFRKCICPTDKLDEMPTLKQKLLDADFIILGSPVYAHQVSGQMKTVIDRLSYWLHLMPLAGKPGIALTTTASTGEMEVLNFLIKIMYPLGLKPVGAYSTHVFMQGKFLNEDELNRRVEKAAQTLSDYISGRKNLKSNINLEETFQQMKKMIYSNRIHKPGEYDFWVDNAYFKCNSFQELIDKKKIERG
ncbi:iron-sulfur flavoprotein [Clostridium homopropionicum DSM 5847]|uniref:Iron-sulfur flavoprotein n=1 Tax=Clostridium homopropionicum DSM 5847 TaxID=1121318 RepID=A0A0L6ZAS9_9CLOT|nr:flavodoxin family protein [Clostridium homopropionicum]KOA20067.1 iron-sulfur flavoprotein [Clostridium homopropionicum DSM 5847]SFG85746.1 Multimeric flavodoxin WrbA [Clostridium homopropionicum]